uniref:GrpE protein homolog n=1 Tax=Ascaris suum TaxID=6253 RepID=F1LAR6_ASCSU
MQNMMMRHAYIRLSSIAHSTRLLSPCLSHTQRRMLIKMCSPSVSSHFAFSNATQSESENNKSESGENKDGKETEPTKFSLKEGNTRLRSADFLKKVKEAVGSEVPDEEFVIPRSAFDALATEYDALLEECTSFKDKYTRALADTENVRRRGQKQVEEAKLFAIQGFCKDLLEVADILDLAVGSMKKEDVETNPQIKSLHEGVEMTRTVLEKVFTKHGLKKLSPEGEKFDPNMHEAVFQVPKDQTKYGPGYVAQVMTIGYALQGRPIRAAKVGVVQSA